MKRVLVTAGQVYGRLDDNKLVGNRVRGVWAARFAMYLLSHGHQVTLLSSHLHWIRTIDGSFRGHPRGTPFHQATGTPLLQALGTYGSPLEQLWVGRHLNRGDQIQMNIGPTNFSLAVT